MFNGRRLRNRREITSGFAKPEHKSQRVRDGDETKSASGRSRVRQNAGLRREFQARVLANAATNAGLIYARFLRQSCGWWLTAPMRRDGFYFH